MSDPRSRSGLDLPRGDEAPRRPGLTSRVVHGGFLNLGGQGVTMLATLVATPFVIRLLGAASYGVLALVHVLIGYLSVADMGMGTASTRFGAVEHARGDGGGLTGAVAVVAGAGVAAALLYAVIGSWLLPPLRRPRIRRDLLKPLARFGGALVVSSIAAIILTNLEKLLLPRYASVQALA